MNSIQIFDPIRSNPNIFQITLNQINNSGSVHMNFSRARLTQNPIGLIRIRSEFDFAHPYLERLCRCQIQVKTSFQIQEPRTSSQAIFIEKFPTPNKVQRSISSPIPEIEINKFYSTIELDRTNNSLSMLPAKKGHKNHKSRCRVKNIKRHKAKLAIIQENHVTRCNQLTQIRLGNTTNGAKTSPNQGSRIAKLDHVWMFDPAIFGLYE